MSMSSDDLASENTLVPTLCVSTVDVSLANASRKAIGSIKLMKNDESLRDVQKTIYAGGVHREEFSPPLTLDPNDRISVSVNCSWPALWGKRTDILININQDDTECKRDDDAVTSFRKETRNVEVLVTGNHSVCDVQYINTPPACIWPVPFDYNFDHPGMFTIPTPDHRKCVGKSSLLHKVFGVEGVRASETNRGNADIDQEFVSPTNERFVVHDSIGFESGDAGNMEIVQGFVARRMAMPKLEDQLHAIWLCLETPYAGGRLLDGGVEEFLKRRREILGQIPLVVVLTKVDQLDMQLELDPPANEDVGQYRSRYLNKYCIGPLHKAAGSDITHVAVSVQDGYSESLAELVNAVGKNMAEYHVDEAPRLVASIAQRVSIKQKIELSIAVGKKKYWRMHLKCAVLHIQTMEDYLRVIRKDVVTAWNFNDPHQFLMDDNIIGALLRPDEPVDTSKSPPNMTSFASFASSLGSALEALKCLSGSGELILSLTGAAADIVISTARTVREMYREAKGDVKILIAYVVDLICIMQAIFLLTSGGRDAVTTKTVDLAVQAYEEPRKILHRTVKALDGKLGRDPVLDEIEKLIWLHSIADHEIEGLKRKIGEVLAACSS